MKKQNPIVLILFFSIFFIVGAIVLMWGIASSRSALLSVRWPSVPGNVTVSTISSSHSSKGGTTYGADIHYTYAVSAQNYVGTKVTFGDISTSNSADASKILARYPVGKAVNVFYNPNDPAEAVLETGFTMGLLLPLGIGTLFTLIGGVMMINGVVAYVRAGSESEDTGLPTV
jgi:hypothetical protein